MSSSLSRPVLVVSDVHLSHGGRAGTSADLARLIQNHQGYEVVLAGDLFDLSVDPPERDPSESVVALLQPRAELSSACRAHLAEGGAITLVAGNHDASTTIPEVRRALVGMLELDESAPLSVEPWFLRRGGVHIEHGHLYDPDNAPAHPLALWSPGTEPLGISLTRRFLAPSGALHFAHAHETTPLGGLARTFRLFGPRAPWIVARYFHTAIRLCVEAGRQAELCIERELGARALDDFAAETGLDTTQLAKLLGSAPQPTHHRFRDTFMRLYFDRIVATLLATSGAAAGVALGNPVALGLAAASTGYLAYSVRTSKSRYSGGVVERLRNAASQVADLTGAEFVIMGHTHHEDEGPRYLNTGSFAFSRSGGRPYVHIDEHGNPERRLLAFGG
jgi:UDP-2,3-diacylglucosamine pyrophosphatase LpxH